MRIERAPAIGLAALVAAFAGIAQAATPASPPTLVRGACPQPIPAEMLCGTVNVPEDRRRSGGRTLTLNVIVLPARMPDPGLPPLFDIEGGPGLPATMHAFFYLGEGSAWRENRDIVMVDQRGTGASNPLTCPELAADAASDREMLPVDAVARCRDRLAAGADLGQYGTEQAIADLDAVRAALGHAQIDIFALSYGTTVALRYMARHPERVRAAVLMGTAPPEAMPPRHHAGAGARALDLLLRDCAADPRCHAAFPSPAADLDRARARLAQAGDALTPELFMERLRALMYAPASARRIPWIVSRAAAGDLAPFRAATAARGPNLLADGMFMSVTCTESFGLMDYESAAAAARATPFGDYRLRRQRAACQAWPRGETASDHLAPIVSPAAVLLVSGRLDPVTPPEWADALAHRLPRSRHLVIRDGGHILDGLANIGCLDAAILRFYATGDPSAPDFNCFDTMTAPPFATGPQPE